MCSMRGMSPYCSPSTDPGKPAHHPTPPLSPSPIGIEIPTNTYSRRVAPCERKTPRAAQSQYCPSLFHQPLFTPIVSISSTETSRRRAGTTRLLKSQNLGLPAYRPSILGLLESSHSCNCLHRFSRSRNNHGYFPSRTEVARVISCESTTASISGHIRLEL